MTTVTRTRTRTVHIPVRTGSFGAGRLLHTLTVTSDWRDSDFDAAAACWPDGKVSTSRVSMGLNQLKYQNRPGIFDRRWL